MQEVVTIVIVSLGQVAPHFKNIVVLEYNAANATFKDSLSKKWQPFQVKYYVNVFTWYNVVRRSGQLSLYINKVEKST